MGLGLATALFAATAKADTPLRLEALGEFPVNQAIVRTTSFGKLLGDASYFAFVDFYGRTSDNFYGEAAVAKAFYKDLGLKLEWNGGSSMDDLFRFGPEYIPQLHEKLFVDLKLYPVTLGTDGAFKKTGQFSVFGRFDFPAAIYLENWTDVNLDYVTKKITVASETTLGKTIVDKLSLEAQVAYNVNVAGFQGRAGLRYDF